MNWPVSDVLPVVVDDVVPQGVRHVVPEAADKDARVAVRYPHGEGGLRKHFVCCVGIIKIEKCFIHAFAFTLTDFYASFFNLGEGVNKMANSHETREIRSLVQMHSFLYITLV